MATAIRVIVQVLGSKQGRAAGGSILAFLFALVMLPVILGAGAVSSAVGFLDGGDDDVFPAAVQAVQEALEIENSLDAGFTRLAYYQYEGIENDPKQKEAEEFIRAYFVLEEEIETEAEVTEEDIHALEDAIAKAESQEEIDELLAELEELLDRYYNPETEFIYRFLEHDEILVLLAEPPFSFSKEEIEELEELNELLEEWLQELEEEDLEG